MNYHRWLYLPAIVILVGLYVTFTEAYGYRLPCYYTPDGTIIYLDKHSGNSHLRKVVEVDGIEPAQTRAIFSLPEPVTLITNAGIGVMNPVPNHPVVFVWNFKFLILLSFLFLIAGVWFLNSANDLHLAFFNFNVTIFLFSLVMMLAFHTFQILFYLSMFALLPGLINLALRTTGKDIHGLLIIIEIAFMLVLMLILYVGQGTPYTFSTVIRIFRYLAIPVILFVFFLQLDGALKRAVDRIDRYKRWSLVTGTFVGIIIPFSFFYFPDGTYSLSNLFFTPALLSLAFPVALIYGTYRIHLIPFQLIFSRSLIAGAITLVLVSFYGFALLVHSQITPALHDDIKWVTHILFLLTLVFFLDPLRRFLFNRFETRIFRMNPELTESLTQIATLLSSTSRLQLKLNQFFSEIQTAIGLESVIVLFSDQAFPEMKIIKGQMLRLSPSSLLWNHITPGKIIVTSYLTYGAGSRGELYRYLLKNDVYFAIGATGMEYNPREKIIRYIRKALGLPPLPIQDDEELRTAFLIGNRADGKKLKLSQIRYLQEAVRLAGSYIKNYALLMRDIQTRKQIRELTLAGQVQRSISLDRLGEPVQGLNISYYDEPVISVSGDYLDIFPLPDGRVAVFLGDVCGHGLGTGYLASAIRSIVRSQLENGISFIETIQVLNLFLMDRYQGDEFITLFAFVIHPETGEMEFLNVAHPPPLIKTPGSGELITLSETQRLLGIISSPYKSFTRKLEAGQRIFLFSDGVIETFNTNDEPFGDDGLIDFINKHGDSPLESITENMRRTLDAYRNGAPRSDDVTFVVAEYLPGNPARSFLHRLERRPED